DLVRVDVVRVGRVESGRSRLGVDGDRPALLGSRYLRCRTLGGRVEGAVLLADPAGRTPLVVVVRRRTATGGQPEGDGCGHRHGHIESPHEVSLQTDSPTLLAAGPR